MYPLREGQFAKINEQSGGRSPLVGVMREWIWSFADFAQILRRIRWRNSLLRAHHVAAVLGPGIQSAEVFRPAVHAPETRDQIVSE